MDLLLLLFCIFSAWTVNDPFCRSSSTLFVGCLLPISVFPSFLSSLMFPLTQFMSGHRFWSSGLKENGVCLFLFPIFLLFTLSLLCSISACLPFNFFFLFFFFFYSSPAGMGLLWPVLWVFMEPVYVKYWNTMYMNRDQASLEI